MYDYFGEWVFFHFFRRVVFVLVLLFGTMFA